MKVWRSGVEVIEVEVADTLVAIGALIAEITRAHEAHEQDQLTLAELRGVDSATRRRLPPGIRGLVWRGPRTDHELHTHEGAPA